MREKILAGGLEITDCCNLACMHCYANGNPNCRNYMKYEHIISFVQQFIRYQASQIIITGGEPLLHPDIKRLIREFGECYSENSFVITTNAIFLDEDLIQMIQPYRNIGIQVSLDGARKSTHEKQRGTNTYDSVITALKNMRDIPHQRKMIRMTISKINYRECVEVAEMAREYDARTSFAYVCKVGRACENWSSLEMNLAQQMYANEVLLRYAKKHPEEDVSPPTSVQSCPFSNPDYDFGLTIHPHGSVDICSCLDSSYIIGNAYEDSFDAMLNSPKIEELNRAVKYRNELIKESDCQDCPAKHRCRQGCIGRAQMRGDIFGQDGECAYRRALQFKNLALRAGNKESVGG